MSGELAKLLADLKEPEVLSFIENSLEQGVDAMELLGQAQEGMKIVGDRFASEEYFLPELIYSGEILKQIVEILKPNLKEGEKTSQQEKVIIGTVAGDIHDIGKNLVAFMLDVNGFEVIDLGIDVPAQKFVETIKESGCKVVGLSGFLSLVFQTMKETVDAISEAGLRENVKIMIGGGQIDEKVREFTGADAYGNDAMEAVKLAQGWIGG
jgi:methanogenic corrinoid protein MtbC1